MRETAVSRVAPAAFALSVVGARLIYMSVSGPFVWEDALISLRYAENLLRGDGLAYNPGERVLGSTAPLYVFFLALLQGVSGPAFRVWWTISSLAFDGITVYTMTTLLLKWPALGGGAAALFTLFMAMDPTLNAVSISGMETPLVLMLMSLLTSCVVQDRPRIAGTLAALLALTRVDGLLFAAVSLSALAWRGLARLRSAGLAFAAVMLPCLLAGLLYFGEVLPNTIAAKRIAYYYPVYRMVPAVWKAYQDHSGPFALLVPFGAWFIARRYPQLLFLVAFDVLYFAYLVSTRVFLFPWYVAPGFLAHYLVAAVGAQGLANLLPLKAARIAVVGALAAGVFGHYRPLATAGAHWERALQAYETGVRRHIGQILKEQTPASSTVLLEPIGYVGYYSGRYVYDAVGLGSKQMMEIRAWHPRDWLYHMAIAVEPDYIVAREDFQDPVLWVSPEQKAEIERRYALMKAVPTTDPLLPSMIVLQRRRLLTSAP